MHLTPDLAGLSWTAIERVHDTFAETAFKICNSGEEVSHQLFIVDADDTGKVLKGTALPPEVMESFFSNGGEGKDAFSKLTYGLLTEGNQARESFIEAMGFAPRVLVFLCEAWMVMPETPQDMQKFIDGQLSASQAPNRQEVLQVMVHLPGLSVSSRHVIKDAPSRHCVRGEFPSYEEALRFSGRFAMQEIVGAQGLKN